MNGDRLLPAQTGEGVGSALRTARVRGARDELLRTATTADDDAAVLRGWGFAPLAAHPALHRSTLGERPPRFPTP